MATVFTALMLVAVITVLLFFLSLGQTLFMRARLETMAELGAMGAGRVIAEQLADRAGANFTAVYEREPTAEEKQSPQRFITAEDLLELQTEETTIMRVKSEAERYVNLNAPRSGAFKPSGVRVQYPLAVNTCDGLKQSAYGNGKTVEVEVVASLEYALIWRKVQLSATGIYSIPVCP